MKIGILTFHRSINYGAFLQAYALSDMLRKKMPKDSVEIIDYIAPLEKRKIPINVLWGIKHYGVINGIHDMQKICSFKKAYKTLPLSERSSFKNLTDLYKFIDKTYDILIIGSDAIFNWNQNGYPTAYIPMYKFENCRIITYAASVHGLRYSDVNKKMLDECGKVFSHMDIVGVRDKNSENFVRACCNSAKVLHCCDPTVFIDKEAIKKYSYDFKNRILKKHKCDLTKKYIVLMLPDCLPAEKIREKYAGKYQIITLFRPSEYADKYLYDLNPFEWASVLSCAEMVVTSYFHGTLLSLRHETPVLTIDFSDYNDGIYEGKLKDLLCTRLGMSECYFDGNDIDRNDIINEMMCVIDKALTGEFQQKIKTSMEKEAESLNTFSDEFQALLCKTE